MTIKQEAREAIREEMAAQAEVNAILDSEGAIDFATWDDALKRLDAATEKSRALLRQMLAEASERARRGA